jgi:hypothetical protein
MLKKMGQMFVLFLYIFLGLIGTLNIVFNDVYNANTILLILCIAVYGALTALVYSKINISLRK